MTQNSIFFDSIISKSLKLFEPLKRFELIRLMTRLTVSIEGNIRRLLTEDLTFLLVNHSTIVGFSYKGCVKEIREQNQQCLIGVERVKLCKLCKLMVILVGIDTLGKETCKMETYIK